jgi:hypothetical protein
MQKITDFLSAVGQCLTGAAQLFSEYNNYRESIREEKSSIPSLPSKEKKEKK